MNKLTTESARQELTKLKVWENDGVLTLKEERYMQALEIALPILEQQEQKQGVGVREGLAALSAHIDSIGGYNFEALEAYRREELGQQEPVKLPDMQKIYSLYCTPTTGSMNALAHIEGELLRLNSGSVADE